MKKSTIISLCTLTAIVLAGCNQISESAISPQGSATSQEETSVQPEAEESTEGLSQRDRKIDTDQEHILDLCKALSSKETDELNTYAAWIEKTFKVRVAVVITDDLEKSAPDKYAKNIYSELYGKEAGILFLVNNETGNDIIYRKGYPSNFISDSDIESFLLEVSPLLVTGNAFDPIQRFFETAEAHLLEFAADYSGTLDKKKLTEVNDSISEYAEEGENISVIYISGTGDRKMPEYAEELSKRFFGKDEDSALMVANVKNGEVYFIGSGKYAPISDINEDSAKDFSEYLKESGDKKVYDAAGSSKKFLSVLNDFS